MLTNIEVQDAPTVVTDDEKAVQHVEGERRCREEIHRGNGFAMIAQKGQPALRGLRALGRPSHPAGDGGFRDLEAEHEEFTMNATHPNLDSRRPSGRSTHGSVWRFSGHRRLVFALCGAWPNTV